MAIFRYIPNPAFGTEIANTPAIQEMMVAKAKATAELAKKIFLQQVLHTHPVTPPPYADSFTLEKGPRGWKISNSDPATLWVEFGAHPRGGETAVLAYHPLGRAIEEMRNVV